MAKLGSGNTETFTSLPGGVTIDNEHNNLGITIIRITEDKLQLLLREYSGELNAKTKWITPLSLFVSILLSLLTASFKSTLGLSADIWTAIFVIAALITLVWLLRTLVGYFKACRIDPLENLIRKIKASELSSNSKSSSD